MKISIENMRFRKYMVKDEDGKLVEGDQTENIQSDFPHLFIGYLNSATIVTEITDEKGVPQAFETSIAKATVSFFFKTSERAAGFAVSMKGEAWTDKRGQKHYTPYVRIDATAYKALLKHVSAHRDVVRAAREIWEAASKPSAPTLSEDVPY